MKITLTLEEINPENGKSYRIRREFLEEAILLYTRADILYEEFLKMKREFDKKKKVWLSNTKMKETTGNLIDLAEQGRYDIIVHGCNCQNIMGAGIAKEIKRRYPQAWEADCHATRNGFNKIGMISVCGVGKFHIVNAYTQETIGNGLRTNYAALRKCFAKIKDLFPGKRIGFPLIGCGLGGGDWEVVEQIINEELYGEDYELVRFNK